LKSSNLNFTIPPYAILGVTLVFISVQFIFGLILSSRNPGPYYDEVFHIRDIERFSRLGWTEEALAARQNYGGVLSYYLPSIVYRHFPTWDALRWYTRILTLGGMICLCIALYLWTKSWWPAFIIACVPHGILFYSLFMTEGASLLALGLGFIFFWNSLRQGSWLWGAVAGLFFALAVMHRQIWIALLGGLAWSCVRSFHQERNEQSKTWRLLGSVSFAMGAGVLAMFFLSGGVFVGAAEETLRDKHVAFGSWLLSFLAFSPFYGLGLWYLAQGKSPMLQRLKWGLPISAGVAILLTILVVRNDHPLLWVGLGPINRILSEVGITWLKPMFLVLSGTLGAFLILEFLRRNLFEDDRISGWIAGGTICSILAMVTYVSYSTNFYERYMLTPCLFFLLAIPFESRHRTLFVLQAALFLLLQAGVAFGNRLMSF
jgi:hypothetical protein